MNELEDLEEEIYHLRKTIDSLEESLDDISVGIQNLHNQMESMEKER